MSDAYWLAQPNPWPSPIPDWPNLFSAPGSFEPDICGVVMYAPPHHLLQLLAMGAELHECCQRLLSQVAPIPLPQALSGCGF